ncbi:TonB-dependent receptor [Methylosinus sp. R-45379]|uniref:TonB-dependent siderophore receptor n=1 Tax=unclassified Methylosinus TaxID=2624500 RepID=UPI0004679A76|nr:MULTISPECIES: TonB-dependent siderophore receptor [unclassified Methylosinus]OAI27319.1 TonB-dependent receptor [Methylosinus sp. R-45379]
MFPTTLSRGVSACALGISLLSSVASAQEALPAIDIGSGSKPTRSTDAAATDPEKQTGYARSASFSATKTNTPFIDTPAAVQVIPHELIADQQGLNTMELVKNVSGVQATGRYFDSYLIRGFKTGYGETYRNGLKLEAVVGGEEVAFTDRVEVVKGPNSVLYGRIEPGGFVNVVTKRPQEVFKAEANEQFGSWGLSRTSFDVTGPVDEAKTVLYRLMGVYDHADSFVNFDHRDNGAVALFLTFRPTQNFEFNVQVEHYEKRQTGPSGVGAIPVDLRYDTSGNAQVIPGYNDRPLNLGRNFSIGDPGLWKNQPYVVRRTLIGYDWTYKFDEKWKITNRLHYSGSNDSAYGFETYGGFDGTTISRAFYGERNSIQMLSTNLDLSGEFETGPITHRPLVGIDWFSTERNSNGSDSYGYPLNIYAPVYGVYNSKLAFDRYITGSNMLWRATNRDFGVYAQDQMSFFDNRIHLLLGGRWDKAQGGNPKDYGDGWASCYPFCTGFPGSNYQDKPKLSPRAAVLFKVTDDLSIYGSYVRSFGSNNGVSRDGSAFPPQEGLQWEVGVKKLWLDGRVTTSLALFDLRKKNLLQRDPFFPGRSIAIGEVASRGIEVDISGQVTENLSVIASYTFDSVKLTNDNNNGNAGHRFNGAAPNVGNIWAKWDTAPHQSEGFEFGGGLYASDERYGSDANTWKLPGYVRLDAMGAYRTEIDGHKVKFQFNIKNLTDRHYFEYSDGSQYAYYGQPRTFMGSVNFQW